jgi:hypothetical protein
MINGNPKTATRNVVFLEKIVDLKYKRLLDDGNVSNVSNGRCSVFMWKARKARQLELTSDPMSLMASDASATAISTAVLALATALSSIEVENLEAS